MAVWRERLREKSDSRSKKNLQRHLVPVRPTRGGLLSRHDGNFVDLCSNDYLALSRHPEVIAAAQEATAFYGAGARASRLITGDYELLEELESALASFKCVRTATVFPSGYQANLGLCSTVIEPGDAVFLDRLSHSCLVDGVRLSGASLRVFPHNDLDKLHALLAASECAPARWILVDGVYSMDGDYAPLPGLLDLAEKFEATLIVDDAHGTGVAGVSGRGTAEVFGIMPSFYEDRLIITATLSKALGAQGGVVLGTDDLREALLNVSRPFVYSTGLAPAAAGAALAALRIIERESDRVTQLHLMKEKALRILASHDIYLESPTPILPIILGEAELALEASAILRERCILALPVRPPTVPRGTSRLRVTIHGGLDEETLVRSMKEVASACQSLLARRPAQPHR